MAESRVAGPLGARRRAATARWAAACSSACKDGRAVAVRGDPRPPGEPRHALPQGPVASTTRIARRQPRAQYPLLRKNGKLERVAWDDALDDDGGAFRRRPGSSTAADAFGVISTGQLVTEEFYALGKLVQLGFGTNNYDGNTTLCMASAVSGYKRQFGSDGPPGAYEDLEQADVILLIGANIADNHPILCQRLRSNPGATLIVVDPRVTKTAMMADIHLPVKPRSDLALLNGIIHILIEHDLIDRDYIDAHTTGFDALRESRARVHAGARRRDHRARRRS